MNFERYVSERHRIFNKQDANKECMNIEWASVSLAGEIGEFCNLVKKIKRDDGGVVSAERLLKMGDELGDIIWYWLFVCDVLNMDPEIVMGYNMDKLKKRYHIDD